MNEQEIRRQVKEEHAGLGLSDELIEEIVQDRLSGTGLYPESRPESRPVKEVVVVSDKPEFKRLRQFEGQDAYTLEINGLDFALTWAQLQSWGNVRAALRRRFPDIIYTWEPKPGQTVVDRARTPYGQKIETVKRYPAEWDLLVGDLYANREVIRAESASDPRGQAVIALRVWLAEAPLVPGQPLVWKDQRRRRANGKRVTDSVKFVVHIDAATAMLERAGIRLQPGEVADILRDYFHGESVSMHIPAPYNRQMRAYRLSPRSVYRHRP